MLGVYFFAQTEEKGALLKGTLRFFCFVASFEKVLTLRFADYTYIVEPKPKRNTAVVRILSFFINILSE